MASSKEISKSKPGIEQQEKQTLPASTGKKATARSPATTAKKAAPVKRRLKTTSNDSKTMITPQQRDQMVAVAAYYRAEKRGFQCRCSEQDWLDAAAEIDSTL